MVRLSYPGSVLLNPKIDLGLPSALCPSPLVFSDSSVRLKTQIEGMDEEQGRSQSYNLGISRTMRVYQ